jgi:hypothetical protein
MLLDSSWVGYGLDMGWIWVEPLHIQSNPCGYGLNPLYAIQPVDNRLNRFMSDPTHVDYGLNHHLASPISMYLG